MVVHKHKEMEQHIRPHTCMPKSGFLGVFPCTCGGHEPTWDLHALAWGAKVSPNLINFKAHLRGFHGDPINWTSRDIKWGLEIRKESRLFKRGESWKRDWSTRLERIGFVAHHLVFLLLLS